MKTVFERVFDWSKTRGISAQEPATGNFTSLVSRLTATHKAVKEVHNIGGYVLNKLEELVEYAEAKRDKKVNDGIDAIADSMIFDMTELLKEGYDPKLVIAEVLLVVESRTGRWDEKIGKFVKDKSKKAQARWYTPNYVKNCKLPEEKTGCLFAEGFEDEATV